MQQLRLCYLFYNTQIHYYSPPKSPKIQFLTHFPRHLPSQFLFPICPSRAPKRSSSPSLCNQNPNSRQNTPGFQLNYNPCHSTSFSIHALAVPIANSPVKQSMSYHPVTSSSSSGSAHWGISLSNTVHSEVAPCLPLPSLPVFCGASDQDLRLFDEPSRNSAWLNHPDAALSSRIADLLRETDVSYL